jgi:MFS family permease
MYISTRDRPVSDSGNPPTGRQRVASTVLLLGVVSLLTDISSEMVNSVLPVYLTTTVGLAVLAYGFIDGIYQGVSALVRIAGGYLADKHDTPKWVAASGYALSALTRIAMLPASGFAAITGVVTADRLGKGLRTAPRDALIAGSSDPAVLGRAFGVHRTLDTVGAAAGPLLAFALLAAAPQSYDSVWVVSFAFAVVGVAVIVLFVPNRRIQQSGAALGSDSIGTDVGGQRPPTPRTVRGRDLMRGIVGPRLRRPLAACGLLGILTVGDGFLYLALQHRDDFAAMWFPLLYVGTNCAYLLLAVPLGRLADRIGRAKVLVGGHVVLIAAYLSVLLPLTGAAATVLTLTLLGAFYAATDGVLPALISRLVPEGARATGIAAAQTVTAGARFVSSVAFGALWLALGPSQGLLLVALLLSAAIPVVVWLLRGAESPMRERSEVRP